MASATPQYAVIFDFDGVLFETEPAHCQAFVRTLSDSRVALDWPEYADKYVGLSDREIVSRLKTRHPALREIDTTALIERKDRAYFEQTKSGYPPIDGAAALLARLRSDGIPIAICSGSRRRDILRLLEQANLSAFFESIVATEDVSQSKPDPEGYALAHARLRNRHTGLNANRCVVVEDSAAGIRAARAAGMFAVALEKDYGDDAGTDPHARIASLGELSNEFIGSLIRRLA